MHAVTVTHNEGRRKREKERGEGFAFLHRLAREVERGKGGYRGGKWPYNFSYIRACIARGGDSSCKARFELGSPPNRFLLRVVTPLARRLDPRHDPPPFATGTTKNSRSSATNSVDRNTIGSGSFRPNV